MLEGAAVISARAVEARFSHADACDQPRARRGCRTTANSFAWSSALGPWPCRPSPGHGHGHTAQRRWDRRDKLAIRV